MSMLAGHVDGPTTPVQMDLIDRVVAYIAPVLIRAVC
jgi:hypothetical protein